MDYSTSDKDSKRIYRQPINYENGIILAKIRDISFWRDTDLKAYESGVQTLMLLLPDELRKEAMGYWEDNANREDLTMDGKVDFDDLLVHILKLLETNNICFPRLTYDIGHD